MSDACSAITRQDLVAWQVGELDEAARLRVQSHLAAGGCEGCLELWAGLDDAGVLALIAAPLDEVAAARVGASAIERVEARPGALPVAPPHAAWGGALRDGGLSEAESERAFAAIEARLGLAPARPAAVADAGAHARGASGERTASSSPASSPPASSAPGRGRARTAARGLGVAVALAAGLAVLPLIRAPELGGPRTKGGVAGAPRAHLNAAVTTGDGGELRVVRRFEAEGTLAPGESLILRYAAAAAAHLYLFTAARGGPAPADPVLAWSRQVEAGEGEVSEAGRALGLAYGRLGDGVGFVLWACSAPTPAAELEASCTRSELDVEPAR